MSEQTSIRQAIEKLLNENKENKIDLHKDIIFYPNGGLNYKKTFLITQT